MLTFHIITFGISVLFGLIAFLFMRSKFSSRGIICTSFFAFLSSELICRVIFYKFMNFRHMFLHGFLNFNQDRITKTVFIVIAINLAVLVLAVILRRIFADRKALFSLKKYKVLPVKAVQYCIIISGVLFLVMSIADVMMPQFAYWKIEDSALNFNTKAHAETNINGMTRMYPLVKLHDNYDKQPDEKIILILGDSFVWGDGSGNVNVLWWRMLQKRIHDEGFGKCRIVAVGQCGASTQDQLYWLEHTTMLEDIKPDMIIIGYVTNDAQYWDDGGTYDPKHENGIQNPAQWSKTIRWWYNKFLMGFYMSFPNIEFKIENDLDERDITVIDWPVKTVETTKDGRKTEVENYSYSDWELKIIEGANLERYNNVAVEPLGKFVKGKSIPCVLMTTPNTPDYDHFHERYKDVMPLFRNAEIPVYDCLDDFVAKHSGDIRYNTGINPVNGHPSIPVNKYYADFAFNMIKENYPEMLGAGNTYSETNTLIVNDWLPYDDLEFSVPRTDEISQRKLLNPSVKDNTITFTYSDEWENNKYLYLPMNAPTVKLCFENPVSAKNIVIRNSDGSLCDEFTVWEAHIGSEGFEEFNTDKLASSGDGKYKFANENITSLNLHRASHIHGEKIYTITFE